MSETSFLTTEFKESAKQLMLPNTFTWSSATVEELIQSSVENIAEAKSRARINYRELEEFTSRIDIWKRKLRSENQRFFWMKIADQTSGLIRRIVDHELRGLDSQFDELPVPQNAITAQHKSWAEYSSSSEEEEEINYLYSHVQAANIPSGIVIPVDLKTVWPKGYKVFYDASQALGLELIEDPLSLARCGFKGGDSLSADETLARESFARLSVDDQRSINMLKSLVMFLKLEPDRTLASDPKFAVSASYVLHFLLKTGNSEDDLKLSRSLKHSDGGRSLIIAKLSSLFQTDRTALHTLMNSIDKVCRSLARNNRARPEVFTDELKNLIVDMCYTSPEGMLEKYYVRERREETTFVNEPDKSGRMKSVKKTRLVNGFRAPKLFLSEELLKPAEKARLKNFEHRFNMPKLAKKAKEVFLEKGGKVEDITTKIEELVHESYALTTNLSTVVRQRKKAVRAEALKAAPTGKLTQSQWIVAAETVMARCTDMPEHTYEGIETFLHRWETGG